VEYKGLIILHHLREGFGKEREREQEGIEGEEGGCDEDGEGIAHHITCWSPQVMLFVRCNAFCSSHQSIYVI